VKATIAQHYRGKLDLASDMQCVVIRK